ncbi:MAG TPA: tRNA lysidine(34) synthetase TilS [Thermoanaerobaculia bacterium]|nr:tRNA lysidine(34) synthetase TilS [Thermoanaerobaculia bacterium]
MEILPTLEAFFRDEAPLDPGDGLIAAFSGGPDSTALLVGLARLAAGLGCRLTAAHLDHAMDRGSAERAEAAARIAAHLQVPFVMERREVRQASESPEAAARRVRYEFLEEVRRRENARWIATGHHRDDQAETVLLRLLFGSGLEGLGGIRPVHGAVVRPLLALPRRDLLAALGDLEPVQDPTNQDLRMPRNRVRHRLLPSLAPPALLARVAGRARAASARIERKVSAHLDVQEMEEGIAVERAAMERLPAELQPFALAWLHRRAGAPYPAGSPARTELLRQLQHDRAACDCGGGWRWETSGELLVLRRVFPKEERVGYFSYTLGIPGEVEIPEIAVRVGLSRHPVEPWMFEGSPRRAALALPLAEGDRVTVRNRRPGDRIHPLGASGSRKLKDLLIDRRVPRRERDRLPLICVGERIAWVPGVTIDQRFRIAGEPSAWIAQIEEITET